MVKETEFMFNASAVLHDYHAKWASVYPSLPLAKSIGCVASVLKEHMGTNAVMTALMPLLPGEGTEHAVKGGRQHSSWVAPMETIIVDGPE